MRDNDHLKQLFQAVLRVFGKKLICNGLRYLSRRCLKMKAQEMKMLSVLWPAHRMSLGNQEN